MLKAQAARNIGQEYNNRVTIPQSACINHRAKLNAGKAFNSQVLSLMDRFDAYSQQNKLLRCVPASQSR